MWRGRGALAPTLPQLIAGESAGLRQTQRMQSRSKQEKLPIRWRRRVLGVTGLLAGLFMGMNGVAFFHARAMTRFVSGGQRTPDPDHLDWRLRTATLVFGVTLTRPVNDRFPNDLGMDFRTVRIPSDGDLEAWWIPAASARGTVLLFHGYGESKKQVLLTARRFWGLGFQCLLVDFRGAGGSEGDRTTLGFSEARDVAAAVRWIGREAGDERPVLYGFSMGGAAVLRAVALEGIRPRAVVVEAVFDRMLTTVEHRFDIMHVPSFPMARLLVFWGGVQNGFDAFSHNPSDYAANVQCPTMVLHGELDERVTVREARAIHDALAGPKVLRVLPGAGHEASQGISDSAWIALIAPFLAAAEP